MAQLRDSIITGSLRVTDTIFGTNLNLASLTASQAILTDANKNLVSRAITNNTSATAVTASTNLITANTLYYHKGNSNIVTVGTITSGTWSATTIAVGKGGTGKTAWTKGGILYASATDTLAQIADGSANKVLRATASATYDWLSYTNANTGSTLVYRDASGNFSAGTITATSFSGPLTGNVTGDCTGNSATSSALAYSAQLTATDDINGFNEASRFKVTTWTSNTTPGVGNGILISAGWTSASYGAQIAIDDDPTWYIALRQRNGDGWNAWKRIPMGDGTGASGTWDISISGIAAEATTASYLSTSNTAGYATDVYGNFKHQRTTNTDSWGLLNNSGTAKFQVYWETGNATIAGGLEIQGHIAGDSGTTGHGLYSGGGYHNAYNNIILQGDATTGSSGIAFVSSKGTTSINQPSDRAFIQYHAYGVSAFAAEGSNPTLATSGELGRLVIGVGNDAGATGSGDQIYLQTCGRVDLLHLTVNSGTDAVLGVIPDTGNSTGSVGGANQPVYISGGVITACTAYSSASVNYAASAGSVAWTNVSSKPTQWDASTAATLSAGLPTPRSTGHAYLCGNGLFISGPYTSNDCGWIRCTSSSESDFVMEIATGDDGGAGESIVCRQYNTSNAVAHEITLMDHSGYSTFIRAYNAVWNDYAEYRHVETEEPGYCVTETSSGRMVKSYKRLQPGCKITSDTYGTCMGETATAKTPIAVAGRVLAYPYRNRNEYELGAAVCSAPNGTVDIMTREEIMMYPERIVGTVSEIPDYEIWHGGNQDGNNDIKVNGRIWIYVR